MLGINVTDEIIIGGERVLFANATSSLDQKRLDSIDFMLDFEMNPELFLANADTRAANHQKIM